MSKKSTATARQHRRRHSWPPLRMHVFKHAHDIDQNPFAFFLSTTDGFDDDDAEDLTAGIGEAPRARSLSPLHFGATATTPNLESAKSPIAKLKRWIERMERRYVHRGHTSSPEERIASPAIPIPSTGSPRSPVSRGRRDDRLSPSLVAKRDVRSHSGRPRVWREPDWDIWPVAEEQEEYGLGISI